MSAFDEFSNVLTRLRNCRQCEALLNPKPIFQLSPTAKILIVGQAPGTKAHQTELPFNDASGDRLRQWLGIDHEIFYDSSRIALMPMGFCYPGRNKKGGDLPPSPCCAPGWHPLLRPFLTNVQLTLLVGIYAQRHYLQEKILTKTVANWQQFLPNFFPLPHPSWRNNAWIKQNPWFEDELLPHLKSLIFDIL